MSVFAPYHPSSATDSSRIGTMRIKYHRYAPSNLRKRAARLPFPLLAAVGARTKKIEIGTAVVDMRYENPLYMGRGMQVLLTSSLVGVCNWAGFLDTAVRNPKHATMEV